MHGEGFDPNDTNEWLTQINGNNLIHELNDRGVDENWIDVTKAKKK